MSAAVFVPVVLLAFYFGKIWFVLFVGALSVLGSLEYRRLLLYADIEIDAVFVPVCGAIALSGISGHPFYLISALLVGSVLLLSVSLKRGAPSAMFGLAGIMYIGGLVGSLGLLRMSREGREWALFVLLITWATDVGAYFGGRWLGRRKMAPTISPGKSWEGAIIGLVSACLSGLILSGMMKVPLLFGIVAGGVLGILGELGDLTESLLKRYARVKDSGNLIPGHGGILDRFDSLLFTSAGGLILRALYGIFV